jgi:hypothetical protein
MMKQQIVMLAMMTVAFIVVHAMPTAVATELGLFLRAADGPTSIFLSKVTDTIFGQDTDNYDYTVYSVLESPSLARASTQ